MSTTGTNSYTSTTHLPLWSSAHSSRRSHQFPYSCRAEQGRLLHALAAGAATRIGETGTGLG